MKRSFILLLILGATAAPALSEEVTLSGCAAAGVEANCILLKSGDKTYDITAAQPAAVPGTYGTVRGTLTDRLSVCQQVRLSTPPPGKWRRARVPGRNLAIVNPECRLRRRNADQDLVASMRRMTKAVVAQYFDNPAIADSAMAAFLDHPLEFPLQSREPFQALFHLHETTARNVVGAVATRVRVVGKT